MFNISLDLMMTYLYHPFQTSETTSVEKYLTEQSESLYWLFNLSVSFLLIFNQEYIFTY